MHLLNVANQELKQKIMKYYLHKRSCCIFYYQYLLQMYSPSAVYLGIICQHETGEQILLVNFQLR